MSGNSLLGRRVTISDILVTPSMTRALGFAILGFAFCLMAAAQQPASTPASQSATPADKQSNAASATQDTSGTTGDQISKPAGAKETTVIGCLTGPDKDGKYWLRSMSHRMGIQVVGPTDLKNDIGSKVKLTGVWQPLDPLQQPTPQPQLQEPGKPAPETHRFQATQVDVMEKVCKGPSETTPVSKNKQQKPTVYNAPSSDASNPK